MSRRTGAGWVEVMVVSPTEVAVPPQLTSEFPIWPHLQSPLRKVCVSPAQPQRADRPAEVVTEHRQAGHRLVYLPVLRETVGLPPLARVAVPIRRVVPLQVRRAHALARAQRAERHAPLDGRHAALLPGLMYGGVAQAQRRHHARPGGAAR